MDKPILCLDFDGVIHSYERGWQNGAIYGTATPGFFDWAKKAQKHFRLMVYSSRSSTDNGRNAMGTWMHDQWRLWGDPEIIRFEFVHQKPPAFITIDDRALLFTGDWSHFDPVKLINFKAWNSPR